MENKTNKEKQEEYAAILLSLVRKQYVKISKKDESKDWDNYNTLISILYLLKLDKMVIYV